MSNYRIYLTKHFEVAQLIHDGLLVSEAHCSKDEGETFSIDEGFVDNATVKSKIPPMYYNKGYYYVYIEYHNRPDSSCPEYSLVIC